MMRRFTLFGWCTRFAEMVPNAVDAEQTVDGEWVEWDDVFEIIVDVATLPCPDANGFDPCGDCVVCKCKKEVSE